MSSLGAFAARMSSHAFKSISKHSVTSALLHFLVTVSGWVGVQHGAMQHGACSNDCAQLLALRILSVSCSFGLFVLPYVYDGVTDLAIHVRI